MKYIKGFTLAELLAVVIIVAVMVVFGVGSYKKSGQQAYFTEVLNKANAAAEELNQTHFEKALQGQTTPTNEAAHECSAVYCVEVTTDYATSVPRNRVACVGIDENGKGKAFCESMGYTNCATGNAAGKTSVSVCTK